MSENRGNNDYSRAWREGFNRGLGSMAAVVIVGLASLWLGSRRQAGGDAERASARPKDLQRLWPRPSNAPPQPSQAGPGTPTSDLELFRSFAGRFAAAVQYVIESADQGRTASVIVSAARTAADGGNGRPGPPVYPHCRGTGEFYKSLIYTDAKATVYLPSSARDAPGTRHGVLERCPGRAGEVSAVRGSRARWRRPVSPAARSTQSAPLTAASTRGWSARGNRTETDSMKSAIPPGGSIRGSSRLFRSAAWISYVQDPGRSGLVIRRYTPPSSSSTS